jgi:hypothetical protein
MLWEHPFDVQMAMADAAGWPSLAVEVWRHDVHGRNEAIGYCLVRLPSMAGDHVREVGVWRPAGSSWQQLVASLGGPVPTLKERDSVFALNSDKSELTTVSVGTVVVECRVVVRGLAETGFVLGPMTQTEKALVSAHDSIASTEAVETSEG